MEVQDEKGNTTFAVNYINSSGVQVFMVAANMRHNNETGEVGTLPFQFFGLHYLTPEGTEIFLSAVFAFLYAFNDTYGGANPGEGQGLPDPGNEDFFYVYPFGVGTNTTVAPEVDVLPVVKSGEGNYTFGIRYRNLYGKIFSHRPLAPHVASPSSVGLR